jgi:hypothetical protein
MVLKMHNSRLSGRSFDVRSYIEHRILPYKIQETKQGVTIMATPCFMPFGAGNCHLKAAFL